MRYTILSYSLLAAGLTAPAFSLAATESACYNVTDADARAYCLARSKRSTAPCYNIQSRDLRSVCMADAAK